MLSKKVCSFSVITRYKDNTNLELMALIFYLQ